MIILPGPVFCPCCRGQVSLPGPVSGGAVFTCPPCSLSFRVSLAQLAQAQQRTAPAVTP